MSDGYQAKTERRKEIASIETPKANEIIEKRMHDAESSDDSLSSDEDDNEEMVGTLYFMDYKNTRFKGILEQNKGSNELP